MAETVGEIKVVATINTKGYDAGKAHIESGNDELESGAKSSSKNFSSAWAGAVAGVVSALTNKMVGAVTNSVDAAIKRVDTLNNSSRVFKNMGFAAGDVDDAMSALNKSILGLPTSLDEAVSGTELLASSTSDIKGSQAIYTAMNDAILGFGGSSADVSNAVRQLSQDLAGGRIQAQTWNSMLNSGLGPALNAISKDMGMTTKDLKDGLSDGSVSVSKFTGELTKLDRQGGGGMASFSKIVKDSTSGIGTGMDNAQTAIARGVADIIKSIGSANI